MTEFRINVKNAKTASALRKLLNEMAHLEVEEIENERAVKGERDRHTFSALCGAWVSNFGASTRATCKIDIPFPHFAVRGTKKPLDFRLMKSVKLHGKEK